MKAKIQDKEGIPPGLNFLVEVFLSTSSHFFQTSRGWSLPASSLRMAGTYHAATNITFLNLCFPLNLIWIPPKDSFWLQHPEGEHPPLGAQVANLTPQSNYWSFDCSELWLFVNICIYDPYLGWGVEWSSPPSVFLLRSTTVTKWSAGINFQPSEKRQQPALWDLTKTQNI